MVQIDSWLARQASLPPRGVRSLEPRADVLYASRRGPSRAPSRNPFQSSGSTSNFPALRASDLGILDADLVSIPAPHAILNPVFPRLADPPADLACDPLWLALEEPVERGDWPVIEAELATYDDLSPGLRLLEAIAQHENLPDDAQVRVRARRVLTQLLGAPPAHPATSIVADRLLCSRPPGLAVLSRPSRAGLLVLLAVLLAGVLGMCVGALWG